MHVIWLLFVISSTALGFDYFGDKIDYWGREPPPTQVQQPEPQPKPEMKEVSKKFNWGNYMNPKNEEFFTEGNYKPPEPFMELARNPTDENIRNWFAMIDAKNKLMDNLNVQMAAYLAKNSGELKPEEKQALEQSMQRVGSTHLDTKRFRFRLYFDSSCPHCQRMMVTAKDLQDQGFYVEVRQIDREKPTFPVPFPAAFASKEELVERKINSWPVLFVGDTAKQLVYRIDGYQPTPSILNVLTSK